MPQRHAPGTMSDVRTVLIVDDHERFRSLARAALERGRFRVVAEAGDGASALDAVARLRPQVVLLDIGLAGEDGFAVCRGILERAAAAEVDPPFVVLISGRARSSFARRLASSGAVGFVPKADLDATTVAAQLPDE